MAAHLEGKGVTALDMAGLAQKGGAVWSHVRIAAEPGQPVGAADRRRRGRRRDRLRHRRDRRRRVAGQDAAGPHPGGGQQRRRRHQRVRAHRGRAGARPATSHRFRDPEFPTRAMEDQIVDAVGAGRGRVPRRHAASPRTLMGDAIATNMLHARLRLAEGPGAALARRRSMRAIELNGAAVELNRQAFQLGPPRGARPDGGAGARRRRAEARPEHRRLSPSLDEVIARRVALPHRLPGRGLCQPLPRAGRAGAARPRRERCPGSTALTEAVARN